MGDAKEFIIDFLKRHHFTSAEAAFKAELLSRDRGDIPVPSCESVLDWELELRLHSLQGTADHFDMNDKPFPTTVMKDASTADKLVDVLPQRSRFPAEKQVFAQHEMGERKNEEPVADICHCQEFAFEDFRTLPYAETSKSKKPSQVGNEFVELNRTGNDLGAKESMCWVENQQKLEESLRGMQDGALVEEENQVMDCTPTWDDSGMKLQHSNNQALSSTVSGFPILIFPAENTLDQTQNDMNMRISKLPMFAEPCTGEVRASFQDLTIQECKNEVEGSRFNDVPPKERGLDALQELTETGKGTSVSVSGASILLENGGFISSLNKRANSDSVLETSVPLFRLDSEQERWTQADWMLNGPVKIDDAGSASSRSQEAQEKQGFRSVDGDHELLPRLPPVRLHSLDKSVDFLKDGESAAENSSKSFESAAFRTIGSTTDASVGWATIVDGPLPQDMPSSGLKRSVSRPSVSQGIVEDMSERLSAFGTLGDGLSERGYPDEYCDSDTYEDDDDPGYLRQPIENEEWFLAHEIDFPSDNERARQHGDKSVHSAYNEPRKLEEDDRSFVEEESYFSGEEYYRLQELKENTYRSNQLKPTKQAVNSQIGYSSLYSSLDEIGKSTLSMGDTDNVYKKCIIDAKLFDTMRTAPAWEGFVSQSERMGMGDDKLDGPSVDEIYDDPQGSVRSGGNLVSSDAADVGSEVRDSLLDGSSEGDLESFRDQELVYRSAQGGFYSEQKFLENEGMGKVIPAQHLGRGQEEERDMALEYFTEAWGHAKNTNEKIITRKDGIDRGCSKEFVNKYTTCGNTKGIKDNGTFAFEGFSFPSPSSAGDITMSRAESGKSLWSNRDSIGQGEETDGYGNGMVGPDDTLAAWKRKSNESSPIVCPSEENLPKLLSNHSTLSARSTDEFVSVEAREDDIGEPSASQPLAQDEEDAAAAQENIRRLGVYEDEYEIFNLRIIHRKNRTGFEEEKDFPVVLNSVIAGRYHVTEYLGSAAFSKAIQAHDLHTGMDVCMKIIKNNKDFFDQSLDEVKLLKFVNKHDPADKYHILRLYDYFYHREHLFIVCELLRANLYEFHKFNRESGGEVYFTMPRLQSITRQCLEALEYLHKLGIIHCDLKPENILVKSYSRCEIKIIDLGSSCFQTDHLCSYVQSRSYRAPEVILGLPYDQKIDLWSLGCILAELCSGNVLFQNDSLATLLARVVGILGPVDLEVLGKGRDAHKYFTKNHMLYERNQETDQLEYLLPKKTSLHHRLPMGDKGFIEFVGCLLQSNPARRPSATEALRHPWLSYPYEPISS